MAHDPFVKRHTPDPIGFAEGFKIILIGLLFVEAVGLIWWALHGA